jgi:hypothetical protein
MADRVPVIGSGRIRNNLMKLRILWDMQPCSLVGVGRRFIVSDLMEAVCTSETSVYSNETTRRYIPVDSQLHTRRRENLKSHIIIPYCYNTYGFESWSLVMEERRLGVSDNKVHVIIL